MTISIPKLRKFMAEADAAHAALMAAGEKVRHTRRDFNAAKETLRIFNDAGPIEGRPGKDDETRMKARIERELKVATDALEAAEAARSDVYERYDLARSLAHRGRDYAASLGVLPADMVEA